MKNSKNAFKNSKNGLRKKAVLGLLVVIGCLLTSCQHPKNVIRERVIQVPTIRTEQVWKYKTDTLYRYETDSILIETIIQDTIIRQKVETKPLFVTVRDTVFDVKTETTKAENKRLKEENKRLEKANEKARKSSAEWGIVWVIAYTLGAVFLIGWLARKRN